MVSPGIQLRRDITLVNTSVEFRKNPLYSLSVIVAIPQSSLVTSDLIKYAGNLPIIELRPDNLLVGSYVEFHEKSMKSLISYGDTTDYLGDP